MKSDYQQKEEEYDKEEYEDFKESSYQMTVMGDASVGKTAFLQRLKYNVFDMNYQPTVGLEYFSLKFLFKECRSKIKCKIWDTTGQPRYISLFKSYVSQANAIFIVVSAENLLQKLQLDKKAEESKEKQSVKIFSKQALWEELQKQNKSEFDQEVHRQVERFIQFVEQSRNSGGKFFYQFILSKMDLIPERNDKNVVFEKFKQSVEGLLKEMTTTDSRKSMDHNTAPKLCLGESIKKYAAISSKEETSQQISPIVYELVEEILVTQSKQIAASRHKESREIINPKLTHTTIKKRSRQQNKKKQKCCS